VVTIDRRPIWLILLLRGRRLWLVAAALLCFTLVTQVPIEDLERDGQLALGVFVSCLLLWITEALPLMITSILALTAFPALGILSEKATFQLFGSEVTFFILGVFILASPLQRSGLSTRIAIRVLDRFGQSPQSLLTAILGLTAAMSCVMSCHAVAAIFLPVVDSIRRGLTLGRRSNFGKALYLSLAWGSIIGGTGTLLGSGRAPLAIAVLQQNSGTTIGFLDWALLAMPSMIAMLVITRGLLFRFFPVDIQNIDGARMELNREANRLGKPTYREIAIGALMLGTIFSWIRYGEQIGLATISLVAVVVAFILGCARWSEVEEDVNWGIVLMYGGALALGLGLLETGAAAWLADQLLRYAPTSSPFLLLGLVAVVCLWLTEAVSNAAVVALLMPPILGIASKLAVDPRLVALFIAIPCGYSMVMPMGTPGMALAYSSGFISQADTVRAGVILKTVGFLIFLLLSLLWWPILGYEVAL
jgi:sodium-dependent dicarboxylate transporter 2/3/5